MHRNVLIIASTSEMSLPLLLALGLTTRMSGHVASTRQKWLSIGKKKSGIYSKQGALCGLSGRTIGQNRCQLEKPRIKLYLIWRTYIFQHVQVSKGPLVSAFTIQKLCRF